MNDIVFNVWQDMEGSWLFEIKKHTHVSFKSLPGRSKEEQGYVGFPGGGPYFQGDLVEVKTIRAHRDGLFEVVGCCAVFSESAPVQS
jgi:hypothetical protein